MNRQNIQSRSAAKGIDPGRRRTVCSLIGAGVSVWTCGPALLGATRKWTNEPLVTGVGEHTYEIVHDWLTPPANLKWGDTHGVCQDAQGRVYVAHTVHPTSDSPDAVAVFDEAGKFMRSWGGEFRNGAHGLDVRREGSDEFLYHCDIHRRLVVKTTLGGEVVWEKSYPREAGVYQSVEQFRPTNVAFAPDGGFYVADGYGSNFIHRYAPDGSYLNTFGGSGSEADQLNCPHGLWVDERDGSPKLVVADRGNRRLQYFTLDGRHLSFVTAGMRMPCHFKTRGPWMLIPDLESVVLIVDGSNTVVAALGDGHPSSLRDAPREQFIPGRFIHPHSATFLNNGDILVVEWVPIGRITLLRKKG